MVQHIDSARLNTDLRYRFDYLSKFLDFTSNDIVQLNQISSIIQPLIPVIVDNVYRKLFSFDITKQYLILRHTCLENVLPSDHCLLSFHSDGMEYRKNMLSQYLKHVFTEKEWNDTFLRYLLYVGQIHTKQLGSTHVHVDYIHLNLLCGYLQQILLETILKNDQIDSAIKNQVILTINKVFWIQNDFFRMNYCE